MVVDCFFNFEPVGGLNLTYQSDRTHVDFVCLLKAFVDTKMFLKKYTLPCTNLL